jgi:hypothetical protein
MRIRAVVFAFVIGMQIPVACAADLPKPRPPSDGIPSLREVNARVLCVGCDEPFDMTTHNEVLDKLASSPYLAELRKALYRQDIAHQFESKAHYDNCDFDSANAYITSLLEEADGHVRIAQTAKGAKDEQKMKSSASRAFFAIGQALHAVQDFYAHTNYVELLAPKVKRITDIEVIAPWRPKGRERIHELRAQGLHSGFVFWGFPQKCPEGTPSHADLAKDSATTKRGAKRIQHLQNNTHYQIAVFLAREASLALMTDAFKRWPLMKELNGQHVAIEVLVDRRGIDGKR